MQAHIYVSSSVLLILLTYIHDGRSEAAWRPQGRFGKRSVAMQSEGPEDSDYLELSKKWKPQGRFGKRTPEDSLDVDDDNLLELAKKWKPQGRFGKREDQDAEFDDMEKRWKPQGRFGKRFQEGSALVDMLKRWKPQGRFGKRNGDGYMDETGGLLWGERTQ